MMDTNNGEVIGFPVGSITYSAEKLIDFPAPDIEVVFGCNVCNSHASSQFKKNRKDPVKYWMSRFSKTAKSYAKSIRANVNFGPKIVDTVKGKLSLSKRVLQVGGVEKVFKQSFSVGKREKLVKALQCNISTTAGPISGMLFISTEKIAFHSDKPINITSPKGNQAKVPYKVVIPLNRIKRVHPSRDKNKPDQKYVHLVTVDDFEFWFMGFVSYQKSLKHLQVQQANCNSNALFL
ncbi:GEM-like protein 7 [Dioscorea cayenensis subsp. rotundata]|uniref:GEM-like protein 7 n=1 Tax=Dioscorea cayennensis subsp. rotundata TaxID=55577 RepID=A0AB40C6U9_DIOCR|nr:GEM-like protein 7 [Dioscorea cayenensis subsp. rotundata]